MIISDFLKSLNFLNIKNIMEEMILKFLKLERVNGNWFGDVRKLNFKVGSRGSWEIIYFIV